MSNKKDRKQDGTEKFLLRLTRPADTVGRKITEDETISPHVGAMVLMTVLLIPFIIPRFSAIIDAVRAVSAVYMLILATGMLIRMKMQTKTKKEQETSEESDRD